MSHADVLQAATRPTAHGLKDLLGSAAWARLPAPVRERFADGSRTIDYVGEFAVVRASLLGHLIAWICRLIGTPVAPHTGENVGAVVHVQPRDGGVEWRREYRWRDREASVVRSTKVIEAGGALVERLPAGLCMALQVYEAGAALHFVSLRYFFAFTVPAIGDFRFPIPHWLSPGTTHVEHRDLSNGWFRFSMTVMHPLFGELFHQTGDFRSSGG